MWLDLCCHIELVEIYGLACAHSSTELRVTAHKQIVFLIKFSPIKKTQRIKTLCVFVPLR